LSSSQDYKLSPAYLDQSTITSSINLNQITNINNVTYDQDGNPLQISDTSDDSNNVWVIQTKFETPILNYNNENNLNYVKQDIYKYAGTSSIGAQVYGLTTVNNFVGIWNSYTDYSQNEAFI